MSKIEKNWLEWLVFAASLVLVAGTLGVLAYDGATMGDERRNKGWRPSRASAHN